MVVLGRIVVPYGVAGWVKLHPFGDDPLAWKGMSGLWLGSDPESEDWSHHALKGLRFHGKSLIAKFVGVDDRNGAEKLDGLYVGAPREDLPKNAADEFYWSDLIGLSVVNEEGEALGTVSSLIEAGGNQVLVVGETEGKRERLLPFVSSVVKNVAVADGCIRVAWGKDW